MIDAERRTRIFSDQIANGMMVAQYNYMRHLPKLRHDPPSDLFYELERRSKGECRQGSATVLHHLTVHSPTDYDRMIMLQSKSTKEGSFKYDSVWGNHFYFLVRDVMGMWHAGSPANYSAINMENHMTRVVTNPNLGEILANIAAIDGGIWPSEKFILEELKEHYSPPYDGTDNYGEPYVYAGMASSENGVEKYSSSSFYLSSLPNRAEEESGRILSFK